MIEEIIPAKSGQRRHKILSADAGIVNRLPYIKSNISFLPFVNFLKEKLVTTFGSRADFYRYMIKKFEAEPTLLEQVKDVSVLDNNEELLELLSTAIFPAVGGEGGNNFTLSAPYQFNIFSYSDKFRRLFINGDESELKLPEEISEEQLKSVQCSMIYDHILEKYYGIQLNESPELVYPVTDEKTGMKRFYRMRYDRRFINVKVNGTLPAIQDCAVCMNTFRILDLEKQLATMPLDLFEVEGFAVWVAEDVTIPESLERIKRILLRRDENDIASIIELKEIVAILIGLSDIEVGLMPFLKINNNFLLNEAFTRHSLMGKRWKQDDEESLQILKNFLAFVNQMGIGAVPVTNLSEEMTSFAAHTKTMYEEGARSYISYPMQTSEGLLGLLEVSSTIPNLLTHEVMGRVEPAIPLLSLAMQKYRDNFDNKIEKMVKEKFTALQPSVEWKFSEVAWEEMKKHESSTESSKIVFENVYPLYGAIDIRNSSIERSYAIQKDLKEQLNLVDKTIDQIQEKINLTLLEGLKFKNLNFLESIKDILLPEVELMINDFLKNELEPVFAHLQKSNKSADEIAARYFGIVENGDGELYHYRNEYEQTLAAINEAVSHYLEAQDEKLQTSYPHYFEKFRTDGIDYNIYIGQAMAPDILFDMLYLKNIRMCQLKSMAEVARITNKILPDLKVPLQTTQLILIHHQPISISFRKDERRFDVEGSYNIRYEVMKKRIDKACVKSTGERLTQPGKIAMVYTNQKEAQEYEEYIRFLQSQNYLSSVIEYLDLEELQGLRGLKALRVEIVL